MKHSDAMDYLDSFRKGEIEPTMSGAVRRHAETCSKCRALLNGMDFLGRLMNVPAPTGSPDTFVRSVMVRIKADKALTAEMDARPRWFIPVVSAGLLASVLLMAFCAPYAFRRSEYTSDIISASHQDDTVRLQLIEKADKLTHDQILDFLVEG